MCCLELPLPGQSMKTILFPLKPGEQIPCRKGFVEELPRGQKVGLQAGEAAERLLPVGQAQGGSHGVSSDIR